MHAMEITLESAAGGHKMKQISRYVAPDQFRSEQETPFGRIVVYSDGKEGWITTPRGTHPCQPIRSQLREACCSASPRRSFCLIAIRLQSVKAVGTDVVEVSSAEGETVRIEFDPGNGTSPTADLPDRRRSRQACYADRDILRLA